MLEEQQKNPRLWEPVNTTGEAVALKIGHSIAYSPGKIFCVTAEESSEFFCFDIGRCEWSKIDAPNFPTSRCFSSFEAYENDKLILFGGCNATASSSYNDVLIYHIQSQIWDKKCFDVSIIPPRHKHTGVVWRHNLLVFGGKDGNRTFSDFYKCAIKDSYRWTKINAMQSPSPRYAHASTICKDTMFVFGGRQGELTLNDFFMYSIIDNVWSKLQCLECPFPRLYHTLTSVGSQLILFGGKGTTGEFLNDCHIFDTKSKKWEFCHTGGAIPHASAYHRAHMVDSFLYVIGGFDGKMLNPMRRIKMIDEVQLDTNIQENKLNRIGWQFFFNLYADKEIHRRRLWEWKNVTHEIIGNIYTPRVDHSVAASNDIICIFGGTDDSGRLNDVHRLTLSTSTMNMISTLDAPPHPRAGSTSIIIGKFLYIFGGYYSRTYPYYNDLHCLNLSSHIWLSIISDNSPSARAGHSMTGYGDTFLIFGGYNGSINLDTLHQFDTKTANWSEIVPAFSGELKCSQRYCHTACVYRDSLYVFGGWNGTTVVTDLMEFHFPSRTWHSILDRGTSPLPVYRHSAIVFGCSMYVYGGMRDPNERFCELYEFNFETTFWTKINPIGTKPTARAFHQIVISNGCLYVFGGYDGNRLNEVWKMDLGESLEDTMSMEKPEEYKVMPHVENKNEFMLHLKNNDLQRRLNIVLERHVCKVCLKHEIDSVLTECYHRVACMRCAKSLQICPVCRKHIKEFKQTIEA